MKGLFHNLSLGISGKLLNSMKHHLTDRFQRVLEEFLTLIRFPNGHITGKCHLTQTRKKTMQKELLASNITHPIIYFNNV